MVLCDCVHGPSLWSLTYVFLWGIHGPLETMLMESALNGSIDCANWNSRLKPTAELHALVSKTPINQSWENAWTPALGDSLSQTAMGWRKGSAGEKEEGVLLLLFSSLHTAACKRGKHEHHNSEPPKKIRDSSSGFRDKLKRFPPPKKKTQTNLNYSLKLILSFSCQLKLKSINSEARSSGAR